MPKVSVITPVYNGEQYVEEALNSLLAQTFQDWEAIVVDDGSTDQTPILLKRYTDPRIKVICQENEGGASARNTGLDIASGEYIAFLDADDLYLPEALKLLVGFLDSHPEMDVVFSDGFICDADGQPMMRLTEHRPNIETGFILEQILLSSSLVTFPVCTLTRQSAIIANGASFDRELVIGEDYDFWIQMARFSQFGYLDQLTCKYRVHQTNITRTSGRNKRHTDLVRGRLKILYSNWFSDLSIGTRYAFFYQLLVDLLSGETEKQEEILQSSQFLALPSKDRATLHRYVAIDSLLSGNDPLFVRNHLKMAVSLNPNDRKSNYILWLLNFSNPICINMLRLWKNLHQGLVWFCSVRQVKPRPVPSTLGPMTD